MACGVLGIEQVPLVHLAHFRIRTTRTADSSRQASRELQLAGKIGHIGLSNVTLEQLEIGQGIAEDRRAPRTVSVSLIRPRARVLERCGELGVVFLAHTPLGRGALVDPTRFPSADAIAAN